VALIVFKLFGSMKSGRIKFQFPLSRLRNFQTKNSPSQRYVACRLSLWQAVAHPLMPFTA
jgi:hypothetical protein